MTPPPETKIDLRMGARARSGARARRRRERGACHAARARGAATSSSPPTQNISPEESGYREVYATEAKTPNQAMAKVKPIADGRRLRAYLATGRYRDELAEARWVA